MLWHSHHQTLQFVYTVIVESPFSVMFGGVLSYVKLGDQITINFTANGTISRAVINITDTSNVYTLSDNNILVNYTLDDSFKDANGVAFNITVYNEDNTTSTVFTHDNLTNTNLIIDSTPPNITLNGDSTITVYTNTIFDDENATAYDLSYGSITITGTGTVNTATPATYTLNYTAPDDYAGNTGQASSYLMMVITRIHRLSLLQ